MVWMCHLRYRYHHPPVPGTHLAAKFSNCTTNFNLRFLPETQPFLHDLSVPCIISLLPPGVSSSEEV